MERIKKKKLLIHSLVFSPDAVSTAYLYNEIAIGFTQAEYEVTVLTTTPHYNIINDLLLKQPLEKKLYGLYFISYFNGIKVIHVPIKKFKSTFFRILSFIYWHLVSFFIAISLKRIDYVLSPSPPLSIGLVSILIGKIKNAKVVYNVQEIYPDLLIIHGSIKSKILITILKKLETYIYNNSDSVITIDQIYYNRIINKFKYPNKLKIITNFVDSDLFINARNKKFLNNDIFNKFGKTILLYAGNIGYYQDWDPILYAAKKLIDTEIEFWIIGDGVMKNTLTNKILEDKITNIKIFPYQDRNQITEINLKADIHFISISKKMENDGFPSKVYTSMASKKPLIVITGNNTPLFNFLNTLNCSILITDNRNEKFLEAINLLRSNNKLRLELGENGFVEINKNYTKNIIIKKYIKLFNQL